MPPSSRLANHPIAKVILNSLLQSFVCIVLWLSTIANSIDFPNLEHPGDEAAILKQMGLKDTRTELLYPV